MLFAKLSKLWLCTLFSVPPFSLTLEARAVVAVSESVGLLSPGIYYRFYLVTGPEVHKVQGSTPCRADERI